MAKVQAQPLSTIQVCTFTYYSPRSEHQSTLGLDDTVAKTFKNFFLQTIQNHLERRFQHTVFISQRNNFSTFGGYPKFRNFEIIVGYNFEYSSTFDGHPMFQNYRFDKSNQVTRSGATTFWVRFDQIRLDQRLYQITLLDSKLLYLTLNVMTHRLWCGVVLCFWIFRL